MTTLHLSAEATIYFELIEGDPRNPCLVFLHEGLGCTAMWRDFPKQLCRQTECPGMVYDRLGYGRSSSCTSARTIHYLHDYALYELPRILGAVIPQRPYIVIGHSDGGSIGLIHGAQRSPLLQGIVVEAAHVFVEPETIAGVRGADEAFEHRKFKGLWKYHGDKTCRVFKSWSETWLSEWFATWNIEYVLPSIQCPVLVIQGGDDRYGTERQVQSIASKVSGYAETFIIDNCGHVPHVEQAGTVLDKITGFIDFIRTA